MNTEQDKELRDQIESIVKGMVIKFANSYNNGSDGFSFDNFIDELTSLSKRHEERLVLEAREDELYKNAQVTIGLNAEDSMKALAKHMTDRISQITKELNQMKVEK